MAVTDLLRIIIPTEFRNPETGDPFLSVDATIRREHRRSAQITRHPIEDGADVTDHAILDPVSLSVEGVISDAPISYFTPIISGLGSLTDYDSSTERSAQHFEILENLWKSRVPFDVVTRKRFYRNMLISSLNIPESSRQGNSLWFSCTLEEVRIIDALYGVVVGAVAEAPEGASLTQALGNVAATAVPLAVATIASGVIP